MLRLRKEKLIKMEYLKSRYSRLNSMTLMSKTMCCSLKSLYCSR
jgi:hypothetical protein